MEKWNSAFTTNLNSRRVCACVNAFLSIDMLDPKMWILEFGCSCK